MAYSISSDGNGDKTFRVWTEIHDERWVEAFSCLPATLKLSYLQYLLLLHTFLLYQSPEKNTGCSLAIFSQKCTIKTQIALMFLATVHKNTNSLFSLRHRDTAFLHSSNLHTTWQQATRHHAVSFFIRLLGSQTPWDLSASKRWLDILSKQGARGRERIH